MGNTVKGEFGIENYDEVSDEICKWFAAHGHVVEVLQVRGISMGEDVTPDTKQPDRYCSILLKLYISNQEFCIIAMKLPIFSSNVSSNITLSMSVEFLRKFTHRHKYAPILDWFDLEVGEIILDFLLDGEVDIIDMREVEAEIFVAGRIHQYVPFSDMYFWNQEASNLNEYFIQPSGITIWSNIREAEHETLLEIKEVEKYRQLIQDRGWIGEEFYQFIQDVAVNQGEDCKLNIPADAVVMGCNIDEVVRVKEFHKHLVSTCTKLEKLTDILKKKCKWKFLWMKEKSEEDSESCVIA